MRTIFFYVLFPKTVFVLQKMKHYEAAPEFSQHLENQSVAFV